MNSKGKHERLADRLAHLVARLQSGEKLYITNLALEYDVSKKTIRRDFLRLERCLPLSYERGVVFLNQSQGMQRSYFG